MSFSGFPPATFEWFAGLEADNSKAYFTAHRETFDTVVRGQLELLLEDLADEYGGHVKLFRPNRDIRFSADKSPYKTATYGVIRERPSSLAALYLQLTKEGLFAGTGYYVLAADQLERFRDAILDDRAGPALEDAVAAAERAKLEVWGETLKTAPRGYPRDHPRARLLRHKSVVAGTRLTPKAKGITAAAALKHARGTWSTLAPMTAWLDEHVGASALPSPARR